MDRAGNIYVTDTENNTIRKITPAAAVTTFAGVAGQSGAADGTGANALTVRRMAEVVVAVPFGLTGRVGDELEDGRRGCGRASPRADRIVRRKSRRVAGRDC